jgi:hypothetical protein
MFSAKPDWKIGRKEIESAVRFSSELIEFIFTVFNQLELVLPEKRTHPLCARLVADLHQMGEDRCRPGGLETIPWILFTELPEVRTVRERGTTARLERIGLRWSQLAGWQNPSWPAEMFFGLFLDSCLRCCRLLRYLAWIRQLRIAPAATQSLHQRHSISHLLHLQSVQSLHIRQ